MFEGREEGIAVADIKFEFCEIEVGYIGEGEVIDFSATDDPDGFLGCFGESEEVFEVVDNFGAVDMVDGFGEDDGFSAGERAADGFVGFASHEDNLVEGVFFKPFEVFWDIPWECITFSDDAVEGHCSNGFEGGE